MKKIFSILLVSLISLGSYAQLDRSQRPDPGPAPELDFGKYKLYELKNGLKIIVVEDHKLPRVTMNLVVDRDPVVEGKKAGYVELAGEMLRQGTTTRPKAQLDEEIDFMGARLSTGSSHIYASGLSKNFKNLVEIMADVAMNPAFPEDEFAKLKKQQISGIQSSKDSPDYIANTVFNALVYGKEHPYGEMMTEETVENVELEDCKTYYNNYWVPNNTYLAVVGDVKAKDVKKLMKQYFGDWAMGNVAENVYEEPAKPSSPQVALVNKDNAVQSVLRLGNTIQLKPGDEDIAKLQLANQILGGGSLGRLFQNIREDKGYTYGAYSSYDEDRLIGQFDASASVRNEVTDSAIVEFLNEFNKLRNEPVTDEELQAAKNYVIGSFGRALEKPQTIANYALDIQRYNLPEDYYETYPEKLDKLTPQDVMDAAKKYITPESMHIIIVGKAPDVAGKVKRFGDFNYYTDEAEVTGPPTIPIPEGATADSVILAYIEAIGGKENLQKVKDIRMKMEVEVPGAPMKMEGSLIKKRPDLFKMEITAAGMGAVQKQVYDGKKGYAGGMMTGGTKELEGEELEELKQQAQFDTELLYLGDNYSLKLTQIAKVNDENAYVMEVTDPFGNTHTEYYSVESGLKLKEESTTDTPQGPMTSSQSYSDYKETNGILYPRTMIINAGGQKITMKTTEIEVNKGVKSSEFTQN